MSWILSIFIYLLDLIVTKKNPIFFDLATYGLQDIDVISLKVEQIFLSFLSFFSQSDFQGFKKL